MFNAESDSQPLALQTSFNYAPVSEDSTLQIISGFPTTLEVADFDYFDNEGEPLDEIVFDVVPDPLAGQGSLFLNGILVNDGDTVSRAQLDNGELVYQAPFGIGTIGAIEYRTSDGVDTSTSATMQVEATYSGIVVSTKGDQTLGSESWDGGDAVLLGGSDFQLGPATAAEALSILDTTFDIDALHFVSAQNDDRYGSADGARARRCPFFG